MEEVLARVEGRLPRTGTRKSPYVRAAQLKALPCWGSRAQPTCKGPSARAFANGDSERMVQALNTHDLAAPSPEQRAIILCGSGHGDGSNSMRIRAQGARFLHASKDRKHGQAKWKAARLQLYGGA